MKVKYLFLVFFVITVFFSQEIEANVSHWSDTATYKVGDVVLLNGIRYMAMSNDNKGISPTSMIWNYEDEEFYEIWDRYIDISEPLFIPLIMPMFWQSVHRDIRDVFREDPFVKEIAAYSSINFNSTVSVGLFKEKTSIHSSWGNFMVNRNKCTLCKNLDSHIRCRGAHFKRGCIVREYNNYTNNKSQKKAIGQIIHNIGDAGVAFGHALSDSSKASGGVDKRERANERRGWHIFNSESDVEDLVRTYFTGTIYDAITKYHDRTAEAILWAAGDTLIDESTGDTIRSVKAAIPNTGDCSKSDGSVTKCHRKYEDEFIYLIKGDMNRNGDGTGDPVWGVTRSAIAVGRFILADFMLTRMHFRNVLIRANPFVTPNEPKTVSAYARDPASVRFLHKDTLKGLSDHAMFMFNIGNDYELWYDPGVHRLNYKWDISGNGVFDDFNGQNLTFRVVEFLDNSNNPIPSNINPSRERFNGRAVIEYRNNKGDNDRRTVRVINSSFQLSVNITDCRGKRGVTARRQFNFFDREPILRHSMERENEGNIFLVKVQHKNSYLDMSKPHYQENGMKVISGFANPNSYSRVFLDAFSNSSAPGGNEADRLARAVYNFGNGNIVEVLGTNQYYSVGKEERLVMNNLFYLEPKAGNLIGAYTQGFFVSSSWNNRETGRPVLKKDMRIAPDDDNKFKVEMLNINNTASAQQEFRLPILTPPVIERARIYTKHLVQSGKEEIEYSGGEPIELGYKERTDMAIVFCAQASDKNNDNELSYEWTITRRNDTHTIETVNSLFGEHPLMTDEKTLSFTQRELLDLNLNVGDIYDVFLKIINDTHSTTTGIDGGYGFTITKVGSFKLVE